jgi:hypothetical protein
MPGELCVTGTLRTTVTVAGKPPFPHQLAFEHGVGAEEDFGQVAPEILGQLARDLVFELHDQHGVPGQPVDFTTSELRFRFRGVDLETGKVVETEVTQPGYTGLQRTGFLGRVWEACAGQAAMTGACRSPW